LEHRRETQLQIQSGMDVVQREILSKAAGAALRTDLDADALSRISASVREADFIVGAIRVAETAVTLVARGDSQRATRKQRNPNRASRS